MARKRGAKFPNYALVMEYAQSIVEEHKIACPELVQGCQRFLRDLENPDYDFDPADAEFVIRFIERTFVHAQGEALDGTPLRGTPFLLEPFHKFQIYNLLGFFLKGTKIRRFKEAFIYIPRKNIKTSFAAALVLPSPYSTGKAAARSISWPRRSSSPWSPSTSSTST